MPMCEKPGFDFITLTNTQRYTEQQAMPDRVMLLLHET